MSQGAQLCDASKMTCKLSVNVNAIAYLRNRRHVPWPDLVHLAGIALQAGAAGITVHPRPDQRHIRYSDVDSLSDLIRDEFPGREYNIEGYPDERFLALVEKVIPDQVTLVPDLPGQGTSDHGWNFALTSDFLSAVVQRLQRGAMRVALFVDPDPQAPSLAKETGADRIEIFTGPYGGALDKKTRRGEFEKLVATGKAAADAGIGLNAGHDLTRANLPELVRALPNLQEVSIGHAIAADALELGLAQTVQLFRKAIGDI